MARGCPRFDPLGVNPERALARRAPAWTLPGKHSIALFKLARQRQGGEGRRTLQSRGGGKPARRAGPPHGGHQLELLLQGGWGGRRPGAGRRRSASSRTPHRARPRHVAGHPVHVTLRAGLGSLRSQHLFPTVRLAVSRASRRDPAGFRVVHFSVQDKHLHLLVEARDARALSSGMRGLAVRLARYVNDLLMRRGPLWSDRWHGRALRSPREVRAALVYVLANFRKHARRAPPTGIDPCSSGSFFEGFRGWSPAFGNPPFAGRAPPVFADLDARRLRRRGDASGAALPVATPRTWLLCSGWRRSGLIGLDEAPRSPRATVAPSRAERTAPTHRSSRLHVR